VVKRGGCFTWDMKSVPPRGSGWFRELFDSLQQTHPLPRGGTDLTGSHVTGVHTIEMHQYPQN
jgi:hypothetical protein